MSLNAIKIGDKVKSVAIERFRGSKGAVDVIGIVAKNIGAAIIHFGPKIGYFYCFKGVCCQTLGLPAVRYVIPVVHYTSKLMVGGAIEYGLPIFLKYLLMGKDDYDGLILKDQVSKDISTKDIIVRCTDEQYQKLSYETYFDAKWRSDAEILACVKDLTHEYKVLIDLSVARTINEKQFNDYMGSADNVTSFQEKSHRPRGNQPALSEETLKSPQAKPVEVVEDVDFGSLLDS